MLSSLAFDADAFDSLAFLFEEVSASVSEAATAAESSDGISGSDALVSEAATAADAYGAQAQLGAQALETVTSADSSSAAAVLLAGISEASAAADQAVTGGLSSASVSESAAPGDSLEFSLAAAAAATEAATAADQAAAESLPGAVAAAESVSAGDTTTIIAAFGVTIDEAVLASESSVSGGTTTGDRMPYITRAQLDNLFGAAEMAALLDRENDGSEDVGVLAYAIANADALIDAHLASRYEVPLVEIPQLIATISAHITRYLLWEDKAPEEVRKRYDASLKQLKDIQDCYLSLPSTVPVSTTGGGGVEYVEAEPVFSMNSLAGF